MKLLFDVPVYRLPKEKYESQLDSYIKREMYTTDLLRTFYANNPDQDRMMRDHLWKVYGGSWQYNEIIGYIRLHFLGTQVRGEWWKVDAKRVVRTRKKIIEYRDWKVVYETEIPKGSSNEEIYRLILEYLARTQSELKKYFVDISMLKNIGPHIDWNSLLNGRL